MIFSLITITGAFVIGKIISSVFGITLGVTGTVVLIIQGIEGVQNVIRNDIEIRRLRGG